MGVTYVRGPTISFLVYHGNRPPAQVARGGHPTRVEVRSEDAAHAFVFPLTVTMPPG